MPFSIPWRPRVPVLLVLAGLAAGALPATRAAAQGAPAEGEAPGGGSPSKLTPEQIQRQREEAERQQAEYRTEKARVEHINERVRLYKELMDRIPFELAPNTSNMVLVYMNGQDLQDIARRIYTIADDGTDEGFRSSYWPTVLYLNRAKDYHTGLPQYGKLDSQSAESNVALFPNIRKQGFKAVVSQITSEDSAMSQQLAWPVVLAYRKRLQDEVQRLSSSGGEVHDLEGPGRMPGETHVALFAGLQAEPQAKYPPRKSTTGFVSTEPVAVDSSPPLDPAPPAWALRQGVNMLGPTYEGYNVQYKPDRFDLAPEFAPIGFLGGRDASGNARVQPGFHFGLNQRFFGFLLTNESAFVAFSAGDAPPMNGGTVNVGLDVNLGAFNLAGLVGAAAVNVVGSLEGGPAFTGKLRVPITPRLHVFGLYTYTTITHYRVEDETGGHNGVSNASYFGCGVVVR